jgi:nucleoside-diphosphate-sugar epimerase
MPFKPSTALITGAAGFVGANLARKLADDGLDVHLLLRPGSRPWRLEDVKPRMRLHEADLLDESALARILSAVNPEVVYHLATYGGYPEQTDADRILRTNFLGMWNLLRACESTRCSLLVNSGSSSEYGFKPHPTRETDFLEPNSYYAVSKAASTLLAQHVARSGRLPAATLRLYSVYGPFEEPTRLIPTLIRNALAGAPLVMVNPETGRDFVFVEDVVRAFRCWDGLLALKGDPVNIGSGIQSTVRTALETVVRLTASNSEVQWNRMPPRIWDQKVWVADISQARAKLGWSPTTSLEEGLRKTLDWHRSWKGVK